jgi:hypothetical protein
MRLLWTQWMHQQMDSLSSLQLYAVIVGVTTVIAMALLEAGGPAPSETTATTTLPSDSTKVASSAVSSSLNHHHATSNTPWTNKASVSSKNKIKGAEPQWYIFKWVNLVAVTLFLAVMVHLFVIQPASHKGYHGAATLDESASTWSPLAQFLVAWSLFCCYCFGFFGVSLVHDSMQHRPAVSKDKPQEEPLHPVSSLEPNEVPEPTR